MNFYPLIGCGAVILFFFIWILAGLKNCHNDGGKVVGYMFLGVIGFIIFPAIITTTSYTSYDNFDMWLGNFLLQGIIWMLVSIVLGYLISRIALGFAQVVTGGEKDRTQVTLVPSRPKNLGGNSSSDFNNYQQ